MRLLCIFVMSIWTATCLAQVVPFDSNLRRYSNGDVWDYAMTSLPSGLTSLARTTLKSAPGGPGRFDCVLSQRDRSGVWSVFVTHRLFQSSGGSLYSGDSEDPTKLLIEGAWTRSTPLNHFANGMLMNPRVSMRMVGRQQLVAVGLLWNCNVFRVDDRSGYMLIWFNTRCGNIIKQEAYRHTSYLPFMRTTLSATSAS